MIRTWCVERRLTHSLVAVRVVDEHMRYVRIVVPFRDSTDEGIARAVQVVLDNRRALQLPKGAGSG